MKWASGIQTCPREGVSLIDTMKSVRRAGWTDFIVFGEPGTPTDLGVPSLIWPYRFGDWSSWFAALSCLHVTRPDADYFIMFEDDISACRNIRIYLESFIDQMFNLGTLHLYTPEKHHNHAGPNPSIMDQSHHGWELWGAQGVVFSRKSLREFLAFSGNLSYRDTEIGSRNANKDCAIGMWGKECGKSIYYHSPSLIQHLSSFSLIGSQQHQAFDYVGDDFDATVLKTPTFSCVGFI